MLLFLDTNAILKRYLNEPGSAEVEILFGSAKFDGSRIVSTAVILEAYCVLARHLRAGR